MSRERAGAAGRGGGAAARGRRARRGGAVPCRPIASSTSAALRTSVAPSRISMLQPAARASNGWPGTASTSRPWSSAVRAVIRLPDRAAASTTITARDRPDDDAVAQRESGGPAAPAPWAVREIRQPLAAISRGEGRVFRRVDHIDAARHHGDRAGRRRAASCAAASIPRARPETTTCPPRPALRPAAAPSAARGGGVARAHHAPPSGGSAAMTSPSAHRTGGASGRSISAAG